MYALFYNRETIGDILMVIFKPSQKPNLIKKTVNCTVLYQNDELIGVNIHDISKVCKIHAQGLILRPVYELVDLINHIFDNNGINKINYQDESGFVVGKVISCVEEEDSEHLHVCRVDVFTKILDIVCGAYNVKEGIKCVVALTGTIMFDGSEITTSKLLGVTSEGMLCSKRELHLPCEPNERGLLILDDSYNVGEDFFK